MFELVRAIRIDVATRTAQARATVPETLAQFADHFPGHPLLPGTTALELAAQVAGPLAEETVAARGDSRWAVLGMVRSAVFRAPIALPAELLLSARIARATSSSITVHVEVHAETSRAVTAELVMHMMALESGSFAAALAERDRRLAQWKEAWT